MTDVISRVPQLNVEINNESWRPHALLQNLPSIVCSLVLNPQPDETILDMCAAPGNKTTHISLLMKGQVNVFKGKKKIYLLHNMQECIRNVTILSNCRTLIVFKLEQAHTYFPQND